MGCTGEKTYEKAVQYEMRSYINRIPNLVSSRKNEITNFINQDLKKKVKSFRVLSIYIEKKMYNKLFKNIKF